MFTVSYEEIDRIIWEEELDDFVPSKVFDAHCHLWREADAGENPEGDSALRLEVDARRMREWNSTIFPGRDLDFYFLGTPLVKSDVFGHNAFLLEESRKSGCLAAAIVTPQISGEQTLQWLRQGFAGLKPYRCFAPDPAECDIVDYLTEEQMEAANQEGAIITLHLSKMKGIAAPANLRDLQLYVKRYPRIKWILAHCARAFNCFMLEKTIRPLADLGENVWCDTSAVCDTYSHYLLMKHFNREHLLFGSDNIGAGSDRGKYITWGRAWGLQRGKECPHCDGRATLVVYEQLRDMKHAAEMAGLSSSNLEDIFWNNATHLFGKG